MDCLVHEQLIIKFDSEKGEILTERRHFWEHVEIFFVSIENYTICAILRMKIFLASFQFLYNYFVANGIRKNFKAVEIVGKNYFRKA